MSDCPKCGEPLWLAWCAACGFDAVQEYLDASAMSTGTAKTPKAVEGRSPASATRKGDAHD